MYWLYGTTQITTIPFPLCVVGENYDFTLKLVTEAGEDLENAYLCVYLPEQAGWLQAKLATDVAYLDVSGVGNASCYLGPIAESTETEIDVRLNFPTGTVEGMQPITLMVGYGTGITPPTDLWDDDTDELMFSDNVTDDFWA